VYNRTEELASFGAHYYLTAPGCDCHFISANDALPDTTVSVSGISYVARVNYNRAGTYTFDDGILIYPDMDGNRVEDDLFETFQFLACLQSAPGLYFF
jgi:hypothetical protein